MTPIDIIAVPYDSGRRGYRMGAGPLAHIDLDVLDPAECGPANIFAAPGGLSVAQAVGAVRDLGSRRRIAGVPLAAIDPAIDTSGRVRAAAVELVAAALVAAAEPG